jgi:hypothetical protein
MDSYRARYIVPGKFAPLKHFMVRVRFRARAVVRMNE